MANKITKSVMNFYCEQSKKESCPYAINFQGKDGQDCQIVFNPILSLEQEVSFLDSLIDMVIYSNPQNGQIEYNPEWYDLYLFWFLLENYSNINVPKKTIYEKNEDGNNTKGEAVVDYKLLYSWMCSLNILDQVRRDMECSTSLAQVVRRLDALAKEKLSFYMNTITATMASALANIDNNAIVEQIAPAILKMTEQHIQPTSEAVTDNVVEFAPLQDS